MNNKEIWDQVCKTDPKHTKKVEFGRRFTAIDAYSQIEKATEVFGPVGKAWGWNATEVFTDNFILIKCQFWFDFPKEKTGDNKFETYGCAPFYDSKKRFDSDAPKKALTDAITKALSYLGFNADVFLGKFDDNKYIAERKQEVEKEKLNDPITKEQAKDLWIKIQKSPESDGKPKDYLKGILDSCQVTKTEELTKTQYEDALSRL